MPRIDEPWVVSDPPMPRALALSLADVSNPTSQQELSNPARSTHRRQSP
jgi:hypothetical protein